MNTLKYNWLLGITIIGLLFLSSCDSVTDSASSSELALVEVRMQNAPDSDANKLQFAATENDDEENGNSQGRPLGNVEAVNIHVLRVEVNDSTNEGTGWETIAEPDTKFNLMDLVNGEFEVLGVHELEEGFYPQIRLILNNENTITVDGEEFDLKVPSGQQTGFKINIGLNVEAGEDYTIMLNFDAERSVVQTGPPNSPGYLLKPTIKATINGNETDS